MNKKLCPLVLCAIYLLCLALPQTCVAKSNATHFIATSGTNKTTTTPTETAFRAAATGNLAKLSNLVNANPSLLKARDEFGNNLLNISSINGRKAVAEYLISKGMSINEANQEGWTALHLACLNGRLVVADLLLSKGADLTALNDYNCTPMECAIMNGHSRVVKKLIDWGYNINAQDSEGCTPLCSASMLGRSTSTVLVLLANGARVDIKDHKGYTPLHYASRDGAAKVVKLLIAKGASVKAQSSGGNIPSGITPLHLAKNEQIADYLLRNGADANAKTSEGDTPLHSVVNNFNLDNPDEESAAGVAALARILIDHRADVNAKNKAGQTPLHYVAMSWTNETGFIGLAQVLIKAGANVNARDNLNRTPLYYALNIDGDKSYRLIDFLKQHGATE